MEYVIYSKLNCPSCIKAKTLLKNYNIDFREVVIGQDLTRDEFLAWVGPDVKTVPQIFIDGRRIGGYESLVEHFSLPPASCFP